MMAQNNNKKLLEILIKETVDNVLLKETVDYKQAMLYKAFIQPFTDIVQTAQHGVKRIATKTLGELGSLTKQVAMLLIPFVSPAYAKQIRKQDLRRITEKLGAVDAEFKDVLTRNWTTLNQLDVWGTLFLVAPQIAIGEKLAVKAPEVALELLTTLVGENKLVDAVAKWYHDARTGGEYGKGQAYQPSSFAYGSGGGGGGDFGGGDFGFYEEQASPQQSNLKATLSSQIKKLLNDPTVKQQIASSPITKALQQEAVNVILNDAKENLGKINFALLKQKSGSKLEEFMKKQAGGDMNKVKELEQKPEFQKGVVDNIKAGLKETYIKQLQALTQTNPAMNSVVSKAIQQIKSL